MSQSPTREYKDTVTVPEYPRSRVSRLREGRAWPYLQLTRPANVITALADILAGYAAAGLSNGKALPWLLLSTAGLYAGGVVLNDVFDRRLDAVERPERPIPSGRASSLRAAWLGGCLLVFGTGAGLMASLTSGIIAMAIAILVVLYDSWGKHQLILGPVNMGACRGLNLLLGISAVPAMIGERWYLALIPICYISAITAVSAGEVHGGRRNTGALAIALLLAVFVALLALSITPGFSLIGLLGPAALLGWRVLPAFWKAFADPQPMRIRNAVRAGVLSLIILDSAIAAGYAGLLYGALVLSLLLMAGRLARVFAVT